ncbi:polysaccharide biosynthesis protein [Clostridium sp. E02]|uniref:polysaccharide biosynthesis protein n=1 Tax=Clostridium sp. E02 TaxID=2487134 RepID=UPI000F541448|nr:polysaccharide biosynthesis protein [Clostridium sp. E02]
MNDSLKIPKKLSPRKYALLTGTLLLTSAGLISRVLGFFYRIFLSRTIGAEGLGIFNLIHPVFGICFALCAGSIQTAISQAVAANVRKGRSIFRAGLIISTIISILLAYGIIQWNDFIAIHILMEPRCAPLLIFVAVSVPCSAIHACINGYYYGMQKPQVPAYAQVMEQTIRIGAVFLIADIMIQSGITITVQLAVIGHLVGEVASSLYTFFAYRFFPPKMPEGFKTVKSSFFETAPGLFTLALPLMGNRLVLNILYSAEAILIPSRLQMSGLSDSAAFSVYGVLTGMAIPFILFPSTVFNSLAVLLLPTVAKAQSEGDEKRIGTVISMSLRYCLYVGILCIGIFTMFGDDLGISVFKDSSAGTYMSILAWLCPFLYLVTTMGSILNGLGRTSTTFIQNIIAMTIRLCFVLFGIPKFGIVAYLIGTLASELLLALMHVLSLKKKVDFVWNAWDMIVKPAGLMILAIGIYYAVFSVLDPFHFLPLFIKTAFHIGFLSLFYLTLLIGVHWMKQQKMP